MRSVENSLARVGVNVGFARAVVTGMVDGSLRAWESAGGTSYHAVHPYGMSLIWGDTVDAEFDRIISHLQEGQYRSRDEWLQIDPRWADLPWERELTRSIGMSGLSIRQRLNFEFEPSAFLAARRGAVPEGWSLVRADESDYHRSGSVVPARFWRSAGDFVRHGGGWRAERDGFRGALAFTSFRFDDDLEIGIETHPEARGQGLATAVAARMIGDLLDRGITPIWSCRDSNHASIALASKLGFRPTVRLPYYGIARASTRETR
ncbi:GNAT family N-acetyltransferase [Microbacterium schleiferi]|uniref:GNAT family N-acetyltransferase n=1 Tax=Microbacterium schleiferi TaxID=69362 RepID=UPI00311E2DB1